MKKLWLVGILLAIVLAADRFTKLAFMKTSTLGGRFAIGNVLSFTQHENHGVIANLPVPQWIIILCTLVALGVLIMLLKRALATGTTLQVTGLAMTIGGALGNLWDRLQWSFVFDWILVVNRSILNLADIAIGAGLLIYFLARTNNAPTLDGRES